MIPQIIRNARDNRRFAAMHGCLSNRNEAVKATIAELMSQFPGAFATDPAQVRPLKLGIVDDIYAVSTVSHRRISAALRSYCNSMPYLTASTEGASRVNLAGEPEGSVTPVEAESARRRLAGKQAAAAKAASKAVAAGASRGTQTPGEPARDYPARTAVAMVANTSGPRRLGIADLKRAAMARKGSGH